MDGGRSRRHLGAGLLMVGVLSTAGLAACTDDEPPPRPSVSAPVTTASSTPPTASATPPVIPKAEPTAKSAEAFVNYFWDVQNYSYATLDLAPLTSISAPECTFCSSTAKDIRALRQAGTLIEGSAIRVVTTVAPPIKITTGIIVATVISQEPGRSIRADGSVRKVPGMTKRQAAVGLNWAGDKWLVDDVAIGKPGKAP